mgnify:CR=1 FL=1
MMKEIRNKIVSALKTKDGAWNGKQIAGLLSLGIVLGQQILSFCGVDVPVNWQGIVDILNTVLLILGLLGVVTGDSKVIISGEEDK